MTSVVWQLCASMEEKSFQARLAQSLNLVAMCFGRLACLFRDQSRPLVSGRFWTLVRSLFSPWLLGLLA